MNEIQPRYSEFVLLQLGYLHNYSDLDREGLCAEPPSKNN